MGYEYEDDEVQESPGKGLRAQLEAALEANKQLQKQLNEVSTEARQGKVTSWLTSKGINAKVAKFIPDTVTSAEDFDGWVAENADVFGFSVGEEGTVETASNTNSVPGGLPNTSVDNINAANRVGNINQSAKSVSALQDFETRIANAKDDAEVNAIMAEAVGTYL